VAYSVVRLMGVVCICTLMHRCVCVCVPVMFLIQLNTILQAVNHDTFVVCVLMFSCVTLFSFIQCMQMNEVDQGVTLVTCIQRCLL
jgi:hypothetical protein